MLDHIERDWSSGIATSFANSSDRMLGRLNTMVGGVSKNMPSPRQRSRRSSSVDILDLRFLKSGIMRSSWTNDICHISLQIAANRLLLSSGLVKTSSVGPISLAPPFGVGDQIQPSRSHA